ncbi:signal peptidase complex catalytic subunit SEC11A [Gossypium australe]|uniref:Signal peptidase complex catalytic subunit SEC11 n=1 Tax=Gossypium australe TaxID=47621 RepID=A0A5B6VVG6_9ROSI|nr:signal peptidase complex catalytic subunit SEC11A [Gossypium australe]
MAKYGEGDKRWIVEERPGGANVHNWHWAATGHRVAATDEVAFSLRVVQIEGQKAKQGSKKEIKEMGWIGDTVDSIKSIQIQQLLTQAVSLGTFLNGFANICCPECHKSPLVFSGREIPIVHRVIKVHERQDTGEVDILTKGDNNYGDDRLLYAQGQQWLHRHHFMGRAVG